MAKTMKAVDAVMVGMGWSGCIMARELTKAGLNGGRAGAPRRMQSHRRRENFTLPGIRDELKYRVRQELMQDTAVETITIRQLALRDWRCPCANAGRLPADGRRPGRRRRALERRHLAVFHERVRAAQPPGAALRQERRPRGHDDPGLGRHLRRTRTALRSLRAAMRHVRQGRQPARHAGSRRQRSGRARARTTIPTSH